MKLKRSKEDLRQMRRLIGEELKLRDKLGVPKKWGGGAFMLIAGDQGCSPDPVARLENLLTDNLGEDWDVLGNPERDVLGVPQGTVEALLRQVSLGHLWPSLLEVASRHSEQWMLDLSSFFPHEEEFVEPLVRFFLMSKSEHAKVSFAQEASEWQWGQATRHLLPLVVARVSDIKMEIQGGDFASVAATLEHVVEILNRKMVEYGVGDDGACSDRN